MGRWNALAEVRYEVADVSQLVEHTLGKGEVTGSIPVVSSEGSEGAEGAESAAKAKTLNKNKAEKRGAAGSGRWVRGRAWPGAGASGHLVMSAPRAFAVH